MSKPQGSSEERPLFIALAHHPFMSFKDGVKYVELRKDAPRWADKHVRPGRAVTLSRGYGKADRLGGWVGRVVRAPDMRLLPPWALDGAALDRTVRAFMGQSQYAPWGVPMVAIEILFVKPKEGQK